MGIGFNLFMVAILIVLTAFFVATEFAIVKLRSSRVDQLVLEGRKNALAVQRVTSNLDGYLSACQLGITITALGLGWLGEPTVEAMLRPLFDKWHIQSDISHVMSFLIAFISVTFLHVVIGELAPKTVAIQKAEAISLATAKPIIYFHKMMYPFIWLLNGSANLLVRLFGFKPVKEHEEAHSEEEIQIILSESYQSGKINNTEYGYVSRIFAFDELLAKEIMVPRTDMICLYTNNSLQENLSIIRKEQYTRFPVATNSKDHIVGMINTKQLFLEYDNNPDFDFKKLVHPILTVPEVIPIKSLLKQMQQKRVHIALLVDEFGGTSGLITIEDILEEIVGEIRDEFDTNERKDIEKLAENCYLIDGKVNLHEFCNLTGIIIENKEVDTIGGWVFSEFLDLQLGKEIQYEHIKIIIRGMSKNRIRKLEVIVEDNEPAPKCEEEPEEQHCSIH
ncbi:hemolysin family protein [Paenibacillus apiarius]|uniref:Hemolysin family protein n=1 Tax=Paenibacillus apiarius TaxID=46240 RepID=A0ABT4DWY1_9BACL|nr:hemolysin family protein [Paenibacillus apiarius]MCY9513814.1 hemolysin family protein [Paenibacillus apiarius]MCY9520486.1 hemolysin family protein [Paenibacillus apiarius]MCY9550619.1 hemolysin family protein [Paenibacillus apiarius]MCY9559140.1 hemolysin family protein [Paenibacillus apiarius]MCY9683065.1 hemolysin family protein [Paenibacillus apiarius]